MGNNFKIGDLCYIPSEVTLYSPHVAGKGFNYRVTDEPVYGLVSDISQQHNNRVIVLLQGSKWEASTSQIFPVLEEEIKYVS